MATHVACYGVFKDSPYENFILRRVVREFIIVLLILLFLGVFFPAIFISVKYYIIFGLILIISRTVTEMYKLFIRVESQEKYKIPSQVHVLKKIPHGKLVRILSGLVMLLFIISFSYLSFQINRLILPLLVKGFFIGFTGGLLTAIGGAYKDGFYEGFYIKKFFRSPLVTAACAAFLIHKTDNVFLILLSSMGFERMIVEFYKGFVMSGYVPGKFKEVKPEYSDWLSKRKIIILPYVSTWILFMSLVILDI